MSMLDDFQKNTDIFKGRENRIDQAAFDRLVQEHGADVARGYLIAMYELTQMLGDAIVVPIGKTLSRRETPAKLFGKISNLHCALFKFVQENGLSTEGFRRPINHVTKAQGW